MPQSFDFKEHLNRSQLEAVNATEGPVLVIAGAGSGKTRVIEYRVLNLVLRKVFPRSILLLTFTRRAAREMLSRASRHDTRCSEVDGGTFHSFAYRILKKHGRLLGFSSFTVIDEDDATQAVGACMKRLGLSKNTDRRFPQKDTVKKIISMSLNKHMTIEDVIEKEYRHFDIYTSEIESLRAGYAAFKMEKGYVDYDDLLLYLKRLLTEHEHIREELSSSYSHIMVDEYQDTNRIQGDITFLLAIGHTNVMAVGDDAQSIYGFRGATHENIMDFPKRFPGCRVIKLEDNYRSQQKILDVANSVLSNMRLKFAKNLTSALDTEGSRPELILFRDAQEEGEWIAAKVLEMRGQGHDLCKNAVLFRSAHVSIALQMELERRSIPFQIFGGMKFYETAHVKDLLGHLKVALNPKDEISWNRILTLLEGVGEKTAEDLISRVVPRSNQPGEFPLREVRLRSKRSEEALDRLARLIESLPACRPGEQFARALEYYVPLMKEKFDDWQQRVNDLESLRQIAERYESLSDFLSDFAIEPPDRGVKIAAASVNEGERPLTLSTIHSAKGLEWENVFLIGMADGILPVSFALSDDDNLEEEQRLFYVAITRARSRLFLSVHHRGTGIGLNQFHKISRFLDAPNVLEKLEQKVAPGADIFYSKYYL